MSKPSSGDDDPLADFDLPPEVMSSTFEHAIGDDAMRVHERGHAVAAALQRKLKSALVDYQFPGMLTVHLASGAVARCGGPAIGWMVDVERTPGAPAVTREIAVDDDEDAGQVADALAKVLKKF